MWAAGAQSRTLDPADGGSRDEAMLVPKHPGWVSSLPGGGGGGGRRTEAGVLTRQDRTVGGGSTESALGGDHSGLQEDPQAAGGGQRVGRVRLEPVTSPEKSRV